MTTDLKEPPASIQIGERSTSTGQRHIPQVGQPPGFQSLVSNTGVESSVKWVVVKIKVPFWVP